VAELTTDQLVQLAWDALPAAHRRLLTQIGASEWEVVSVGLGHAVDDRVRSSGGSPATPPRIAADNKALGIWVPELRLVLINETHPQLENASAETREELITNVAWHEWGHALSVTGPPHDLSEGDRLLAMAPAGIRERIRRGDYSRR
jgi:hypothetical protein